MRRFASVLLIIILFSRICSAQYTSLGIRLGFGTYAMLNLKDFQKSRKEATGLPLKTTENYPASPVYRIELDHNSEHYISKWGVFYAYNSTGARSTLSDYSGRMNLDAIINGHQLGISLEHQHFTKDKLAFGTYIDLSFIETNVKFTDYLTFFNPTYLTIERNSFRAYGFCAEPGVYVQYNLFKHLKVRTNLGALVDFSGDLHVPEHKIMKLSFENNPIKPQWSGLRIGFQVDI